jgi:MaoC dehydratase-like protein
MALNRSLIRKMYPPERFVVTPERALVFANAVGHPGDGVPPTFVTAPEIAAGLANVVGDADLGLDLSRVLHSEQEYGWTRPLEPGETVTATATIEDIRGRPSLELLTLRTEIRDASSAVVCVARSTLVHRGEP